MSRVKYKKHAKSMSDGKSDKEDIVGEDLLTCGYQLDKEGNITDLVFGSYDDNWEAVQPK